MHSWSLVCFTLLTQSAIGLVWLSVFVRWAAAGPQATFSIWSMPIALTLTGLGLGAALAHLAKPRLAPHALRNLAVSWLSREVLLVQAFAGALTLLILLQLLDPTSGQVMLEAAACLTGAAALFAMTRVYMLKTVPAWNSAATVLEFAGSAMLLGGALTGMLTVFGTAPQTVWRPAVIAAASGMVSGLILKLAAIWPALAAEGAARTQTWFGASAGPLSAAQTLTIRFGLNLSGLLLALAPLGGAGPTWMGSGLSLACLAAGEVIGRRRFYQTYQRIGL